MPGDPEEQPHSSQSAQGSPQRSCESVSTAVHSMCIILTCHTSEQCQQSFSYFSIVTHKGHNSNRSECMVLRYPKPLWYRLQLLVTPCNPEEQPQQPQNSHHQQLNATAMWLRYHSLALVGQTSRGSCGLVALLADIV